MQVEDKQSQTGEDSRAGSGEPALSDRQRGRPSSVQQCGKPGTGKCEALVVTFLHKVLREKGAQTSNFIVVTTETHISTG